MAFLDYYARGGDPALTGDIQNIRRVYDQQWAGPILARWEKRFPVRPEHKTIAGVPVDIVTPAAGVAADKRDKVLLNFHGGGFVLGNGDVGGRMEAVTEAGSGGQRSINVDDRQALEAVTPAPTEDERAVAKGMEET